jgi:hypothetical protein
MEESRGEGWEINWAQPSPSSALEDAPAQAVGKLLT